MSLATVNGSDVASYAVTFTNSGLSPVRVATDGSKSPVGKWLHLQEQRMDADTARREFAGRVGVGIIHGAVSGGTEVIDLDNAEIGRAYLDALAKIDNELLQKLTIIETPRPGYHLYYRCNAVEGNQKLAMTEPCPALDKEGNQKLDPSTGKPILQPITLIETRGEGGFTVAPGSPLECHETRRPYRHIQGPPLTDIQRITPEERQSLLSLARTFDESEKEEPAAKPASTSPIEGISLVDDYCDKTSWEELLPAHGWLAIHSHGPMTYWRRPGKDGAGWSATTGLASKAGRDLLCVFSTSAHPFEGPSPGHSCSTHSKFDVYARYHHAGDHSAAAKALGAQGFGDQPRPGMPDLTGDRYGNADDNEPSQKPKRPALRWRKFPVHTFPRVLRNFIQEAAESIGCDPSLVAVHTLAVCASVIGNTRRLRVHGSWYEPSVLWVAAVGESGVQKSPAMDVALKPLSKLQRNEFEDHRKRMEAYEVALQKYEATKGAKFKGEGEPPVKPTMPACTRHLVNDTTMEALAPILEVNSRGILVACEELAGWFGAFDQYRTGKGGSDVAKWLSMFGARELVVDRRTSDKRTIYVERAAASICGTIQPRILTKALSAEHRQAGLAARFLFVYPPRTAKQWREREMIAETEARYAKLINRLNCLCPTCDEDGRMEPKLVQFTEQGKAVFKEFVNRHGLEAAEHTDDIAAAYSKLEGIAARVALVFAMAEDRESVDETATKNAIELIEWFKHETQRIYAMFSEDDKDREQRNLADTVARLTKSPHGLTANDLRRGSAKFKSGELDPEKALNALAKGGYGEWHTVKTGGHPGRYFRLFPADKQPAPAANDLEEGEEEQPADIEPVTAIAEVAETDDDNDGWEEI